MMIELIIIIVGVLSSGLAVTTVEVVIYKRSSPNL